MRDMWEILGLDGPENDLKVIKRAYAKRLRETRPDDDPEGFMALREALEGAKTYVRFCAENEDADEAEIVYLGPNELAGAGFPPYKNSQRLAETNNDQLDIDEEDFTPEPTDPTPSDLVIEKVEKLLRKPARAYQAAWTDVLEDDILETIDAQIDFEDKLRCHLLAHFGYFDGDATRQNQSHDPNIISPVIARTIFETMGWNDAQKRPYYVQDQIEWLRDDLGAPTQKPYYRAEKYRDRHIEPRPEFDDDKNNYWQIGACIIAIFLLFCTIQFLQYAASA